MTHSERTAPSNPTNPAKVDTRLTAILQSLTPDELQVVNRIIKTHGEQHIVDKEVDRAQPAVLRQHQQLTLKYSEGQTRDQPGIKGRIGPKKVVGFKEIAVFQTGETICVKPQPAIGI